MSAPDAYDFVDAIPIIHVYGSLGALGEVPIEEKPMRHVVTQAVKSLRIISESSEDTEHIQERIRNASTVCFLGFGFHPENTKILGLSSLHAEKEVDLPYIHATTMGMYPEERKTAFALFDDSFRRLGKFDNRTWTDDERMNTIDNYTLLRRAHGIL